MFNLKAMAAAGLMSAAAVLTTAVLPSGVAAAAPRDPNPQMVGIEKHDNEGGGVHQHKDNPN
jgi:hypothetical protein